MSRPLCYTTPGCLAHARETGTQLVGPPATHRHLECSTVSLHEPASTARPAILRPFEKFLHVEAASGVVLLAAALAALIWANSPWVSSYEALWHAHVGLQLGSIVFGESLHFIINDGLMTIFFLVVGLEIRREIHDGT